MRLRNARLDAGSEHAARPCSDRTAQRVRAPSVRTQDCVNGIRQQETGCARVRGHLRSREWLNATTCWGPTTRRLSGSDSSISCGDARCSTRGAAPASPAARAYAGDFDAAWCRWVACFVTSPPALVAAIARALKPGGVAIFHEYADYASWRLMPGRGSFDAFVAEVMANWRHTGGEPDIGRALPSLLRASGFRVRHVRPLIFAVHPCDFIWQWPSTFLKSHLVRLVELGRRDAAWAGTVRHEFDEAERDPTTVMLTPLVLEIVALKEGQ